MKPRTQKSRMGHTIMAYFLLASLMNGLVAGSLLNRRQADNTEMLTVIAPTAPPESLATSASTIAAAATSLVTDSASGAESISSASETTIPDRPVLASPTTSDSETASTAPKATSTASNSTVSHNSTLNEYNDPSFCHVNYTVGVELNPFCSPVEGAVLDVNASYKVTWDPTHFDRGSNISIVILDINATQEDEGVLIELTLEADVNATSALGFAYFNTTTAMLNGSSTASLGLLANSSKDGQPVQYSGPIFELQNKTSKGDNSTTGHSDSSSSSSKKLGEKVGIPIGLIFFLVILAVLAFFFLRYRRNSAGYASNKALSQPTGSTRTGGAAGGHRRQESFHDEPTSGGVELQNRNRGLTGEDTWEWGRDSVGSPTSPTSGNQFRDELARQKTVGRR